MREMFQGLFEQAGIDGVLRLQAPLVTAHSSEQPPPNHPAFVGRPAPFIFSVTRLDSKDTADKNKAFKTLSRLSGQFERSDCELSFALPKLDRFKDNHTRNLDGAQKWL